MCMEESLLQARTGIPAATDTACARKRGLREEASGFVCSICGRADRFFGGIG